MSECKECGGRFVFVTVTAISLQDKMTEEEVDYDKIYDAMKVGGTHFFIETPPLPYIKKPADVQRIKRTLKNFTVRKEKNVYRVTRLK